MRHALAAYASGAWAEGERLCLEVLKAQPDNFEALSLSGIIAAQTGRTQEAAEFLGRAVAANPTDAGVRNNYGAMLQATGQLDEALACYEEVIRLKPDLAEAHNNRGFVLRELKRWNEALKSCEQAIRLKPDYAEAFSNRGAAFQELKQLREALASYERSIELKPDFAEAHYNRGAVLQELGQPDAAVTSYDMAIALAPNYATAHYNRGNALQELMQIEAAVASYDRAVAINPAYADAHWNKALALLLGGDFVNGWPLYEWRRKRAAASSHERVSAQPLWTGKEAIAGKTILLYAEQGLGDTIQFCRYAKLVADLGARVVLEVQAPLLSLLATLDGVSQCVATGAALPPFDYQCPLMSLPLAFGTDLTTIPAPRAYLRADAGRSVHWRQRLGEKKKLRVGLVWAGGFRYDQPELWGLNERRNIALAKLARLKDERVEFYSLQKGEAAESDLARLQALGWDGPEIIDHTGALADFADTAALVDNLDLVISVDTSTAHLAGALGKPVWILNRYDTCWRWLLERDDSPWYPTARLYRQQRAGDWDEVLDRVKADLDRLLTDVARRER